MATELCRVAHADRSGMPAIALAGSVLLAATVAGCSSGGGSSPPFGSTHASGSASTSASASATTSATGSDGTAGSTGIPTAAWITPSAIPLYAAYHWPAPSGVAKAAKAPELSAVQDCQLTLSSADQSELGAFPAAQETILATNDTSSGDIQGIYNLYTDLVADLGKCSNTATGAKVSVAVNQGPGYAATITIPTSTGSTLTWHEYLAAPYGYLVELSVYVAPYSGDKPSASWDGSSASTVLSALQSGPCAVTKLC